MALTLALSGCGGNVVVDGSAAAQASNALVVNVPEPDGICAVVAAKGAPGAVFLLVASQPITCAHPELLLDLRCPAGEAEPSTLWEVCIPLQPPLAPMTTDILAIAPLVELASAPAGCANSSGEILQQGALAITTVDSSSMTLTLSGTSQQVFTAFPGGTAYEVNADGTYEALRCP
jgi:hypothetical protein